MIAGATVAGGINIEIGPGELLDRIIILRLKVANLADEDARLHAAEQLARLESLWDRQGRGRAVESLEVELAEVNARQWKIEDALRACEERNDFGASFVELARGVYMANDRRAEIKAAIDETLGYAPGETKVYSAR